MQLENMLLGVEQQAQTEAEAYAGVVEDCKHSPEFQKEKDTW